MSSNDAHHPSSSEIRLATEVNGYRDALAERPQWFPTSRQKQKIRCSNQTYVIPLQDQGAQSLAFERAVHRVWTYH